MYLRTRKGSIFSFAIFSIVASFPHSPRNVQSLSMIPTLARRGLCQPWGNSCGSGSTTLLHISILLREATTCCTNGEHCCGSDEMGCCLNTRRCCSAEDAHYCCEPGAGCCPNGCCGPDTTSRNECLQCI